MTTFDYLLERVTIKVKGWKEKFLTIAGKEILIKAVVQAVPSFAMSCFLLPKGLCNKIEQKSREFWWGNGDKRGINWVSWDRMKQSRDKGGIGFRDMESFNLAMLAKQGWRILVNPQSLVARILKAKYFRDTSVIDARLGGNPSYAWRSIMAGLKVLKKGHGSFCVYSPRPALADRLVRDYVIDGSWNIDKLNLVLWPVDVYDITRMMVPQVDTSTTDVWSWYCEDSGCYSVKSGYGICVQQMEDVSAPVRSTTASSFKWTKDLWKMKTQKKFSFLIWRIAQDILPTRATLFRRHITKDPTCPFCDCDETSLHALVQCSTLSDFWAAFLPLPDKGAAFSTVSNGDWVRSIFCKLSIDNKVQFTAGLWAIWLRRNRKVFQNTTSTVHNLLDSAGFFAQVNSSKEDECQTGGAATEAEGAGIIGGSATVAEGTGILGSGEGSEAMVALLERNDSNLKGILQFDGARRYALRIAGGGALVLDQFGNVRCAKARKFNWGNRAKEIEALYLEMGIDMAIESGITHLTVEGDAETLLDQTAGRTDDNNTDRTVVKDIVDRIRQKPLHFTSIFWNWVPRDSNFRAHKLAERGPSLTDSQFWDSDFPAWLYPPNSGLFSVGGFV